MWASNKFSYFHTSLADTTDKEMIVYFFQLFHWLSTMTVYFSNYNPSTKSEGYSFGGVPQSIPSFCPLFLSVWNHISVPIGQIWFILGTNAKYHVLSISYKFGQNQPLNTWVIALVSLAINMYIFPAISLVIKMYIFPAISLAITMYILAAISLAIYIYFPAMSLAIQLFHWLYIYFFQLFHWLSTEMGPVVELSA